MMLLLAAPTSSNESHRRRQRSTGRCAPPRISRSLGSTAAHPTRIPPNMGAGGRGGMRGPRIGVGTR
ncbi:hypothetical protein T484DRAFT_1969360 [Baffinella frigidus]|nr:hypothetical protein T484DRAFT_1969360 [Cryptophyta sp. CCMP2293]